jgi:hypothetical protein
MTIHTTVGLAVHDANVQARELSIKRPKELIMAVVTHDKSGVFLSWASPQQDLADNEVEAGWWKNGVKQ